MDSYRLMQTEDRFSVLVFNKKGFPFDKMVNGNNFFLRQVNDHITLITNQKDLIENLHCDEKPYWVGFQIIGSIDLPVSDILQELINLLSKARISILPVSSVSDDFFLIKDFDLTETLSLFSKNNIPVE